MDELNTRGQNMPNVKLPNKRAFAGLLLTGALFAQQPATPPAQPNQQPETPIFRANVRIVMTPVTVTDRNGEVVTGLTSADFHLLDNGKPQKIEQDMASHPISMVIAVQANSQVEKILPQIQKLGSAIQQQILGDDGEVAIMEFDHRMQTLSDFTSDPDTISKALKKLKPGSSSSRLNDAAIEAVNLLKKRPATRRKVLLLISESRDNGSELKAREVLTAAEFANVNIYSIDISHLMSSLTAPPSANRSVLDNRPPGAVYLGNGNVETPTTQSQTADGNWAPLLNEIYIAAKGLFIPNPLKVYTNYTGGRQYSFMNQKELDRAVSELGEELHSQYLLTYTPNNQEESGFHTINVQVLKPDLKVRARDGYYIAGGKTQ
jgi:VWFA-related protein